jgi:hypothetical protein
MGDEKKEAYYSFLNDLERVAESHGWNIYMSEDFSDDNEFPRVVITFGPAIGMDAQNRKF